MIGFNRPDLVIFDCDGVLVESEAIANRVFAEMVTAEGYPITPEASLARFKGGRFKSIQGVIEEELGRSLGPDWIPRLYDAMYVAFRAELKPVAGVVGLIDALAAEDVPTCVASNGPIAKMQVTLGITDLWRRFEGRIFSADMVARPKPAPDLFRHAADTMGARPARCLVIEDSPPGVRGGLAAGMNTIALVSDPADRPAMAALEPTWMVEDLSRVTEALRTAPAPA